MNAEIVRIVIRDLLDELVVDQVMEKRAQIGRDVDLRRRDQLPGFLVHHRINVELEPALKHAPERLEDSAFEIEIIFLVENFEQARHAHDEADHLVRVTRQIGRQPIVFAKLRDQNRPPERAQNIHARQKIRVIQLPFGEQVLQRHFHQHHQIFLARLALLQENAARAVQHVVGRVGDRPKTSALDQDRLFIEHLRRLHGLAIGREHDRIRQALAHQLQTHQPVVHLRVSRTGKLDHVHLDAVLGQILLERRDQLFRLLMIERAVKQIHARPRRALPVGPRSIHPASGRE